MSWRPWYRFFVETQLPTMFVVAGHDERTYATVGGSVHQFKFSNGFPVVKRTRPDGSEDWKHARPLCARTTYLQSHKA